MALKTANLSMVFIFRYVSACLVRKRFRINRRNTCFLLSITGQIPHYSLEHVSLLLRICLSSHIRYEPLILMKRNQRKAWRRMLRYQLCVRKFSTSKHFQIIYSSEYCNNEKSYSRN